MNNKRGILSGDRAVAYAWIVSMVDACEVACDKAEEVAFGGVEVHKTVSEVIAKFNELRSSVHFHARLTNDSVAQFGYQDAPVWPEMNARLQAAIKRCAIAGDLIEAARSAAAMMPSAAQLEALSK